MSEHQYYEFLAIDRPLTPKQMQDLRASSTRATITPTSFVNHYNFGDLKGSPVQWMHRYFDAHLYFANWGTRVVMLRVPRKSLDGRLLKRYCGGGSASAHIAGEHVVLSFRFDPEEGGQEVDGADLLSCIAPVRDELIAGDHRALYLGWLRRLQSGEIEDKGREPPCPAGLGELSPALEALAEFLCADPALVQAAVERSSSMPAPSPTAVKRHIRSLSPRAKNRLLLRVTEGDHGAVRAELSRAALPKSRSSPESRAAGALLERAAEIAEDIEAMTILGRIRRTATSRSTGRRLKAEIDAMTARLRQEIASEGGRRIETIAQAMSVSTRDLVLPVKRLIVSGEIRTQGHKRATSYFLAAHRRQR